MTTEQRIQTKCPISGSTDLRDLRGYERHHLVKSHPVGFVFSSRIPDDNEYDTNYSGYSPKKYLSPITVSRYEQLLKNFDHYKQSNRLFDVGCGRGFFLSVARRSGWQEFGNELSSGLLEVCREQGLNVRQGDLEDDWFDEGYFDVVTAFELLEHLSDPISEIKKIHRILRPGGLFFFTTPNFNSIERMLLKADYNVISYPDHLSYYTPKTVNYLLTGNGFKKLKVETTGISLTRLKASYMKKKGKEFKGRFVAEDTADEKLRTVMESNKGAGILKVIANNLLTTFGIGNSLKGWYQKV